jgi:CHAD domain-containing protein
VATEPVTSPQALAADASVEIVPDGADAVASVAVPIDAATNLGESLCAYARKELRRARQCLSWRQAWLHRGVHQGRKSLRRVRATLALAGVALGRSGTLIDGELRRINTSLSDLRDGQALVEAVERLSASGAALAQAALLVRARRRAVGRRAELGRQAIGAAADARDNATLIDMLLAGLQALPWADVREADVLHAIEGSERRAATAGLRAIRSGNDDDWHRWRRRARRLSQQHRALDKSAMPSRAIDEHQKKLAVLLGEVQDFSLLAEHCGAHSPFPDADRRPLRALADAEVHRLRARLHDRAVAERD